MNADKAPMNVDARRRSGMLPDAGAENGTPMNADEAQMNAEDRRGES